MYRLPIMSVFLAAVLVGQVHPTPLNEQLNSSGFNITRAENATDAPLKTPIKTTTEVIAPEAPREAHAEGNSPTANKTEVTVSPTPSNKSTLMEQKDIPKTEDHPCNYKKEIDDMLKCRVTPHDSEDGEVAVVPKGSNNTVPQKKDTTTIYHTVLPPANKSPKTNFTDPGIANAKRNDNHTEITTSSIAPLLADNIHNAEHLENSVQVRKTDNKPEEEEKKNMPPGIIALVTAVTFVLAVVFAYISIIAWRRYVEYKYGHRELLVNDLEFDSNDLRHFEL